MLNTNLTAFTFNQNWLLILDSSLCENCPYSELFWSAFARIQTEYREILRTFPYLVRMRKSADQNNSEYAHFLRSVLS